MDKKYSRGSGIAHPVDVYVGRQIRKRCKVMGLSQTCLAAALGVTFQQVQKYQSAKNRVSCSMLYEISQILERPLHYFFPKEEV